MLDIVPATLGHVVQLLPNLRHADIREIISATGEDPMRVLVRSVGASEGCWAALGEGGEPIVLFGYGRAGQGTAVPWMVASIKITAYARDVARLTRPIVDEWASRFELLTNYADCRNTLHLRWLRWAGFTFTSINRDFSHDGTPFVEFRRTQQHVRTRHPDGGGDGCFHGALHREPGGPASAAEGDG